MGEFAGPEPGVARVARRLPSGGGRRPRPRNALPRQLVQPGERAQIVAQSKIAGGAAQAEDAQAAEFGAALRQTRLAAGRDIADIARQLRIRQSFLQAIEEGRFDALPGPTYAIGFVRAYADYLGLDQEEVVKRYKELRGGVNTATTLLPPAPVTEGRLPTGTVLLLAVVLAAVAYGGWYYLSAKGRNPGELVTALPDRIAKMVGMKPAEPPAAPAPQSPEPKPEAPAAAAPTGAPPAATPSAPAAAEGTTPAPAAGGPAPAMPAATPGESRPAAESTQPATAPAEPAAAPSTPAPAPQTATAPAPAPETAPPAAATTSAPAATAAGAPPPAPAAEQPPGQIATATPGAPPGRVVLRANSSSWVEIRNAQDVRVFSRLMRAGETYAVPATPGLSLTTGNAGGLTIEVDGKALPPLGKVGDVRRDFALDADALLKSAGQNP